MIEVLISREDAHAMELVMNADGQNVRDGVRYWITPFLKKGEAIKVEVLIDGGFAVEDYPLNILW